MMKALPELDGKIILTLLPLIFMLNTLAQKAGIFDGRNDVGDVLHAGTVTYNNDGQQYELSGAGANIWFKHDELNYVWKQVKGNFILQTRGVLLGKGTELHRKFGWMVRTSLDSTSAMVCATVHGDGLTSLQYRKIQHTDVEETRSSMKGPDVLQLERKGNQYIMSVAHFGETYVTENVTDVNLGDDVYVGLFICSHNKDVVERVSFDNVRIIAPAKENFVPYRDYIGSHIELMDVNNGNRQLIYSSPESLQAPNWTKDGKSLIYNSKGLIYRFDIAKRTPQLVNTEPVVKNNNDHVISFNGKMLGLSATGGDPKNGSLVFTVPIKGGKPKQVTPTGPSYLHGWSPDGRFLLFTGQRNNEFDIYKVPSGGGEEVRLTTAPGLDDGSEYSPDGRSIYFNSTRSGTMQIWRMSADGSNQEQLTNDEFNNWFPHISPDGKSIVFLSFSKDIKADDHPWYKHVYLRLMPVNGKQPTVITYLYGGQGSINTPSWSPDGKRIAFVSNSD
ncbi:MAG: biopolymer transporter TolR [Chitinophagaceae bacterium]